LIIAPAPMAQLDDVLGAMFGVGVVAAGDAVTE
jgi:hypothetical protein